MLRGAELTRLLTSLVMLAVLGMLISEAQDAHTFLWLCGKQAAGGPADPANLIHGRPAEQGGAARNAAGARPVPKDADGTQRLAKDADGTRRAPATVERAHGKPLDLPPPPSGPTDLDEDERGAAAEEFQALTDRTLELHGEEMPAYWRLFSWVRNQSLAGLSKRAVKDVVLNDFMQSPDDFRGRLVALELNVRRVLRYPATKNRLGIENIYEVTGFTTESQAWLYFGLTADLPKGMPVGSSVEEQATFYGYFLKLQGYYQAGAKPNERPLEAPVLIGRMVWHPAVVAGAQGESFSQIFWVAILGAGLVVAGGVWLIVRLLGRRPAAVRGRTLQPQPIVPMDQWLRTAAEDGLEIDGADAEAPESDSGAADGDGQGRREYGGRLGGVRSVGEPGELSGGNGSSNGR